MSNYTTLDNFSTNFLDPAITEWKVKKDLILDLLNSKEQGVIQREEISKNLSIHSFANLRKYVNLYHISVGRHSFLDDKYSKKLLSITGYKGLSFFVSMPGKIDTFHIDTERSCAINFPIEVDFENSQFRIGINPNIESYTTKHQNIPKWQEKYYDKKGKGTFLLEDNEYETYNLEKPVIFNTKVPHGGANFSDTIRVIGSIGFSEPMDNILPEIKDWL